MRTLSFAARVISGYNKCLLYAHKHMCVYACVYLLCVCVRCYNQKYMRGIETEQWAAMCGKEQRNACVYVFMCVCVYLCRLRDAVLRGHGRGKRYRIRNSEFWIKYMRIQKVNDTATFYYCDRSKIPARPLICLLIAPR